MKLNTRSAFSRNVQHLMNVYNWSNTEVTRQAFANGGYILSKMTVSNILKGNECKTESIDAFAAAFNVTPSEIINPIGFDESGKSLANSASFPTDALNFAINCVMNLAFMANIEDRDWIKSTIQEAAHEYLTNGQKAAESHAFTKLKNSNLD